MKKIKMLTAGFLFAGLFAMVGSSTNTDAVAPAEADSATGACWGCCPPDICGVNGPDFDGTTVDDDDSSCEEQAR